MLLIVLLHIFAHRDADAASYKIDEHALVRRSTRRDKYERECHHDSEKAMANYRAGRADLFFFHITHNAGTTVRQVAMANGVNITMSRGGIAEEGPGPKGNLSRHIPCNSDEFVSVISMRDPVSRSFAFDGMWQTTATENLEACSTDNYGLRKLIGKTFGEELTQDDVEFAKRRLECFDIVMDVGNFANSIALLCAKLGWDKCPEGSTASKGHTNYVKKSPTHTAEDLMNPDVYRKLKERNRFETELYQHAVKLSQEQLRSNNFDPVRSSLFERQDSDWMFNDKSESQLKWVCPKNSVVGAPLS
jgi:hypothetical protein